MTQPTLEVTTEEYDRVFDINVKSIFFSVAATVPQFQKQGKGGAIINISSISATRPRPGLVWYAATKGAVSTVSFSSPGGRRR
jgi:NAD(P)-dependent dehydrogenase (short-subunit alcohol dehydrogenase family)